MGLGGSNAGERTTEEYLKRSELFNCFRELIDTMKQAQHDSTPLHSTANRPFHEEFNVTKERQWKALILFHLDHNNNRETFQSRNQRD